MFVNLTPHAIEFRGDDGSQWTVMPSGTIARIDSLPGPFLIREGCAEWPEGIRIHGPTCYGAPIDLPPPKEGVTYIVSALFAGRVGDRIDVVYPGTGPNDGCVRYPNGQVRAVTRLIRA